MYELYVFIIYECQQLDLYTLPEIPAYGPTLLTSFYFL